MLLSRWKCLLALCVVPLACHEAVVAPGVGAYYTLQSVGGEQPPVVISASPGDTTTVFGSTVSLGPFGEAQIFERIRYVHPGVAPAVVETTTDLTYVITGDVVQFAYKCPIDAICVAGPVGKLSGLTLTLTYGDPPYRPPFVYFHPAPD
ncbi:MAG TPA: hypothetical protein VM166_04915 [Gemmatimonadaceae bacterium]|nr:hypothetical protein [Gemmatimonadaceae bacterium]